MKTFYSQMLEDLFVYRNFINNNDVNGIFLEVGAVDGIICSNTLFFEKELGFSGIMIEPTKEQYDRLVVNRPKCFNVNSCISDSNKKVTMIISEKQPLVNSVSHSVSDNNYKQFNYTSSMSVSTTTISEITNKYMSPYIDFMSIDVEGHELELLNSIDWNIEIYLICIELDEHNKDKDQKCRNILLEKGFVFRHRLIINEFWENPNYFRKDKIFSKQKKDNNIFSKKLEDYGNFNFYENLLHNSCKTILLDQIYEYEKTHSDGSSS
tara:strand:+ start:991 stop:1788 length:798 start_codon:yes stop_codon:yes gene_type:complete